MTVPARSTGPDAGSPVADHAARALQRTLRAAVLEVVGRGAGRSFEPTLSVGDPQARWSTYVDRSRPHARRPAAAADGLDHALRTDVVAAMLADVLPGEVACRVPVAWLARPTTQEEPDCEREWLAAAASAFGELGLPLVFVVVTRSGWRDPRTGAAREWRRLRASGRPARGA